MLRTKFKYIFFLSLFIVFVGCEKQLSYQLKIQKPQTVMYAFPMPDSTLKIHAGLSTGVLSNDDYDGIEGLVHSIKVGGNKVKEGFYPFGEEWLTLPSVVGEVNDLYEISYELPDGTMVSANTIIPEPTKIINVDTISTLYTSQEGKEEKMLRCSVQFKDIFGSRNYYQIRVDYKSTSLAAPKTEKIETIQFIKEDKVFLIRDNESVLLTDVDFQGTFTDYLFDGSIYKVKLLIPNEYLISDETLTQELIVHLFSLTPEYYKFLRSSIEEEAFRDYPVFEPINLYSNIKNGIGVVAGLSVDTVKITLP